MVVACAVANPPQLVLPKRLAPPHIDALRLASTGTRITPWSCKTMKDSGGPDAPVSYAICVAVGVPAVSCVTRVLPYLDSPVRPSAAIHSAAADAGRAKMVNDKAANAT